MLPILLTALQDAPTSAAPAAPKWTGSVTIGASFSDGNTERTTVSTAADAECRREKDRTKLGFLWNYAEEASSITERKTQARAQYDYFFSKQLYGLAQASAENDFRAALELRTTLGVGAGYQFADTETWKLSAEAGLSYFNEDFKTDDDDQSYLAARLAAKWDHKPSDKWTVGQLGEFYPSVEDVEDVYARLDTKARVELGGSMYAQGQWIYAWDNTPASGKERVDNLLILGLGWSF
jgi:putative salt-induced outer membrane protein YdiY